MRCFLTALLEDRAITHAELREAAGGQYRLTEEVIATAVNAEALRGRICTVTVADRDLYVFEPARDHALWKALDTVRQLESVVRTHAGSARPAEGAMLVQYSRARRASTGRGTTRVAARTARSSTWGTHARSSSST